MAILQNTTVTATDAITLPSGTAIQRPGDVVEIFTASGSWTAPTGVTSIQLLMVGGGGAGGQRHAAGGSGGSVAYYGPESPRVATGYPVTPGTTYPITIGTGGQGPVANGSPQTGPYTPSPGGPGSSTTFGSGPTILSVSGGSQGGSTVSSGTTYGSGGGSCGTTAQGFAGGGGAGAGGNGTTVPFITSSPGCVTNNDGQGGHGGIGIRYSIGGKAQYYAAVSYTHLTLPTKRIV